MGDTRLQPMTAHTPTPWMTMPCGELLPYDVMIVADLGKNSNGIQAISTVARALSIRQDKETTAANAAFIVEAVNSHASLKARIEELEGALTKLAAYNDVAASLHLKMSGSYGMFDEPYAVKLSRAVLQSKGNGDHEHEEYGGVDP
jgi:hypothetical protein